MPFIFAIVKANVGFSVIAVLVLTADKGNMVTALLLYQQCLLYPDRTIEIGIWKSLRNI